MSIWTIIVAAIAIGGLIWFFPKMPGIAQIVVAIIVVIVCLMVLLNLAGVPTGIHF